MNIAIVSKIVLTTVDVLIAGMCLIVGHKDKDYSKFTLPIIFIILNIGGMWI